MIGTATGLAGSTTPEGWDPAWPLPPSEATPAQVYDWRLRHRATDAIDAQTAAMRDMLVEQQKLLAVQTEIRDELRLAPTPPQSGDDPRIDVIFRTIEAVKAFVRPL